MKSAIVLILLLLVDDGYDFEYSEVETMQIYTNITLEDNDKKISTCTRRATRMNRQLQELVELSEKLSWSEEAIEYELKKYPDLRYIDADDLKKAKAYCKIAKLTHMYK